MSVIVVVVVVIVIFIVTDPINVVTVFVVVFVVNCHRIYPLSPHVHITRLALLHWCLRIRYPHHVFTFGKYLRHFTYYSRLKKQGQSP